MNFADLVEDERLADGAPCLWKVAQVQSYNEREAYNKGDGGLDGVDEEAHDHAAHHARHARVPAEVLERRSKAWVYNKDTVSTHSSITCI